MAEGDMTAERPISDNNRIPELENPDEAPEIKITPQEPQSELPITDLTRRSGLIGIPQIPRRGEIQERRNQEAEDKFMQDVVLLERMKDISKAISTSPISEEESIEFHDPEKVLIAYSNSDDHHRKNIRTNIRTHLEKRKYTIFGMLDKDLRKLYADQGLSKEEVDEKIEGLTTGTVGKKRRHLNQLPKEAQVGILQNMAEERNRNLISNFDEYMHALSFSNPFPFPELTAKDQQAIRDRFAKANDREKATIAAEVRHTAKVELRQTFETNLGRLEKIEFDQGYKVPLIKRQISSLKEMYNRSGLSRKAQIVSEVQEEKLNLVTPNQLNQLSALRKILEHGFNIQTETDGQDLTNQQRAQNEVEQIITLVAKRIANFGNRKASEIEMEETQNFLKGLARTYENPNLVKTYELALLLRLSRNDFFRF